MNTYTNKHNMRYAPTDTADLYPDTDGQPMAASDLHLEILIRLLQALEGFHTRSWKKDVKSNNFLKLNGPGCNLDSLEFSRETAYNRS